MAYVNVDILIEILSRLPVKSIFRFKCVCKSWYALFSDPYFVSDHLTIQCQSTEKLMLLKRLFEITPDSDDGPIVHGMCIISENNMHDPELPDLPDSFQIPEDCFDLIGHCDGLIAVNNWDKDIIVCNPATRDFRILPDSCLHPPLIAYGAMWHMNYRRFLGFGYDKAIKDHKIVRVVTFSWLEAGFNKIMNRAEVFCIGAGCWREINLILDSPLPSLKEYVIGEPFFDGVYYWLALDEKTKQRVLFSFHMDTELFRITSIPMAMQEFLEQHETDVNIGVYNDSIALYIHCGKDPKCVEIWALKKVGVKVSWSKERTVKTVIDLTYFIGFWNGSDKEYLYADGYGELAIYNSDTTESKSVPLEGVPFDWEAVPYMRTLVSVQSKLLQLLNRNRFTPLSEWAALLEAEAARQDHLNSLPRATI